MPLRDHFRPPLDDTRSWEELHGQWPAVIVQQLNKKLPPGYLAVPRVHSGSQLEVDVAAFETDELSGSWVEENGGGVATAVWAPAKPSVSVVTSLPEYDEYEVRVYDARKGRLLVASIEIVSPANKDRPGHRKLFVAKCAALLQKGVSVSIIDLVTTRKSNLYLDLMDFIGEADPTLGESPPATYAASCRWTLPNDQRLFEAWSHVLTIGQPLPTLPLWLNRDRVIPLELEASYEQACLDLRIT